MRNDSKPIQMKRGARIMKNGSAAKWICLVLLFFLLGISYGTPIRADLTTGDIKAEAAKMIMAGKKIPEIRIVKMTKSVNKICAVAIDPPYREYPNVLVYISEGENDPWTRVSEGLSLGIQPYDSGLLDLHTQGDGVDFKLTGANSYSFGDPNTRKLIQASEKAGSAVVAYGNFFHTHPGGQAFYSIDKTLYHSIALKLFGSKYEESPSDKCSPYDTPGIIDLDLEFSESRYLLTAKTDNSQVWRVSFSGIKDKKFLINKNIEAEAVNEESLITSQLTQKLHRDAIKNEKLPVSRIIKIDYAFAGNLKEHQALQGYGVLMVAAVSHDANELPLAGAYILVHDLKNPLPRLKDCPVKVTDHLITRVLGGYRTDSYFLIPYSLTRRPTQLLVDWKANRRDFGVIDFPTGDALPFVKNSSYLGLPQQVDKAILSAFLKREFYLDMSTPATDQEKTVIDPK